jgi:hypothetical protein
MFPGEYSGIVEPWRHYVPLEKDFSNMAEVAARLRDDRFVTELTERAHADLVFYLCEVLPAVRRYYDWCHEVRDPDGDGESWERWSRGERRDRTGSSPWNARRARGAGPRTA